MCNRCEYHYKRPHIVQWGVTVIDWHWCTDADLDMTDADPGKITDRFNSHFNRVLISNSKIIYCFLAIHFGNGTSSLVTVFIVGRGYLHISPERVLNTHTCYDLYAIFISTRSSSSLVLFWFNYPLISFITPTYSDALCVGYSMDVAQFLHWMYVGTDHLFSWV